MKSIDGGGDGHDQELDAGGVGNLLRGGLAPTARADPGRRSLPISSRDLALLQRTAGNAAVAASIAGHRRANSTVQRCGPVACDRADGEAGAQAETGMSAPAPVQRDQPHPPAAPPPPESSRPPRIGDRVPSDNSKVVLAELPIGAGAVSVQRDKEDSAQGGGDPAGASPNQSYAKDVSSSAMADKVDQATARTMVDQGIAAMSGMPGVVVNPFPDDLVASNEPAGGGSPVQALAAPVNGTVQRLGGGKWGKPEGGFIGSLQLCYDLCKAEFSLIGWVWAGAGVTGPSLRGEAFYGAYVFAQKPFGPWPVELPKLSCGTCAAQSDKHSGGTEWGAGLTGFPSIIKPNEKVGVKSLGVEIGALLTPHASTSDANLEIIALVDVTQFLGPIGMAVKRAEGWVNTWAPKLGVKVECGIGFDFSGDIHLCKSVPGGGIAGITSDSAKICGGGYVGCNINLPHDPGSLPH